MIAFLNQQVESVAVWLWRLYKQAKAKQIATFAVFLSYGCNFPWIKEERVIINSCAEGLRPVIFKRTNQVRE